MQQIISGNESSSELEKTLLNWCRQCTQSYREVDVRNFTSSWKDGLAFNALIHYHRPHLFDYHALLGRPPNENLTHAFEKASNELGLSALLDPEDVNNEQPDKKSIIMYITTMYDAFTRQRELTESDGSAEEHQAARSDSPTPSSVSTMSEWDDYNETLTQVLAWLLQAETQLKQQEAVSDFVDQVKEQFREHEEFMMILTSHQTSVGSVLEFGSQLINEGIVAGKEEKDIREQMAVLSERWENLRVSAMSRQTELHQHLMKLQQLQLKDLSDWLTKAESEMDSTPPIASDLETVKAQVERHKKFQEELESQQQHVNSLSHMVVVVDESESENATVDLENQLAILGERWSSVCKWTEHRWENLQEVLISWQKYRNEEMHLNNWLHEKETALKEISVIDMGDRKEVQKQIQNLKNLEIELTQQQNSFGEFNHAAQRVAQTLEEDSPAIQGIQDTMEDFNQRWNTIASMLNTKMKHLRGIEAKLDVFLQQLEENVNWINDTELLLGPDTQKELVESLDQAVKKRRASIIALTQRGDDIMQQSQIAGQSVASLQNYLKTFTERWENLTQILIQRKTALEFSERKNIFMVEIQRIIVIITEITIHIEQIFIECKHNPKEFLIKIEIKFKELDACKDALEKLSHDCKEIDDPVLQTAVEKELELVSQKLESVEMNIKSKQVEVEEVLQRTPPPEFTGKITSIKVLVDEIFPQVSIDFRYNDVNAMQEVGERLKGKLEVLQQQDITVKLLITQEKEMLKGLSPDKSQQYHKQLSDVARECTDCSRITESRIQRVNEAVLQTKELETAMKETFSWMDDVDKFLKEITGTIAEGDVETIESQIQEVEALQQDIETVQKKVDSLIETCTLIINRSDPAYAEKLQITLTTLNDRWNKIITLTESQKENLRTASLKFQEIGNGVKDVIYYLKDVEKDVDKDSAAQTDENMMKTLQDRYQDIEIHLSAKAVTLKEYSAIVQKLIAVGGVDSETPHVCVELEQATQMHALVSAKVKALLDKVAFSKSQIEELDNCLKKQYMCINALDSVIASVTEELDGDDQGLQDCLKSLHELSEKINSEEAQKITDLSDELGKSTTSHIKMITVYETRVKDIKERYKKVQNIVEGEVLKRQQLHKDVNSLYEWLIKIEIITNDQIAGKTQTSEQDIEALKEEISMNEALLVSAERAVSSLGATEQQEELQKKLGTIRSQWKILIQDFEQLKKQPKQKELEMMFSTLEGSVLSGIDNLKRKLKKIQLISTGVVALQSALSDLKDLRTSSDQITADIVAIKEVAKELFAGEEGTVPAIEGVEKEYDNIKKLLDAKEKMFEDALPLSEYVYTNLAVLKDVLAAANINLQNVLLQPLPVTPEESIEIITGVIKGVKDKAGDVQQLFNNTSQLRQMSDEQPFIDMETKVHNLHHTYNEILSDGESKIDVLNAWIQELDDYEKKVDDLNAWIDSRLSTLESIGGVSAKFDVEMELQKLQGLKSFINSKESELDLLKARGDEIANKASSSLVDPFEKKIFQRWDDLEHKINRIESDLQIKLREFAKAESSPPEKRRIVEIDEVTVVASDVPVVDIACDVPVEESVPVVECKPIDIEPIVSIVIEEPQQPMEIEEEDIKVQNQPSFQEGVDISALESETDAIMESVLDDIVATEIVMESFVDDTITTRMDLEEKADVQKMDVFDRSSVSPTFNIHVQESTSNDMETSDTSSTDSRKAKVNVRSAYTDNSNIRIKITAHPLEPKVVVKKEPLKYRIEEIIVTIETIEKSIEELKCTTTEDVQVIREDVQKLEDDLEELQPQYESLLEEANDVISDLNSSDEDRDEIMKLTRTFGGVHNNLAVRKHNLQGAEYKLSKLNVDIMKVQLWLQDVEKAMLEQSDQYNFEEIEDKIEINAAEMEGVNIRAEQLAFISSDNLIPRKKIASLNKRFKIVSSQFEQFQRPEERVTTYKVSVQTGGHPNTDTRANVYIKLFGEYGNSDQLQLRQSETKRKKFQPGQVDLFSFQSEPWLGKLSKLRVWHDNEGANPQWFLSSIYILDELSGRLFCFVFDCWLSKESGAVLKEIPVSAMGLSKEAASDVLIKKHRVFEMQWLFETINSTVHEPKLRVEEFVSDIKRVVGTIDGIHLMFKHPCFLGKPYDNLAQQQKVLQEVGDAIEELNPTLTKYMLIRNRYLDESTPEEMHKIDINLTNMRAKWNAINKEYKTKYFTYEANSNVWKQFHDYMDALSVFLTNAENQLANIDRFEDEAQTLHENLQDHDEKLNKANQIAAEICSQSSPEEASSINEKMSTLNVRWTTIKRQIEDNRPRMVVTIEYISELKNQLDTVETQLEELEGKINEKPHPVIEEDLSNYIRSIQDGNKQLPHLQEKLNNLDNGIALVLAQDNLAPAEKEEFKTRFEKIKSRGKIVICGMGERKIAAEDKLKRASDFLEELEELSMWMSATRDLLEGQKAGRQGYNVDPETMKLALETRKSNVESINKLLLDFKAEGELTNGQFPDDVGDKISRLSADWQVIVVLAISLKEPVQEEYILTYTEKTVDTQEFNFESEFQSSSFETSDRGHATTANFESNVAQMHDWLKLVEQKVKGLNIVIGDEDDMESSLQKAKSIKLEMDGRKVDVDDAIEMGAALNLASSDESAKYVTDDKVSKLKEHWESVSDKIEDKIKVLEQINGDWRGFNESKVLLVTWLDKTMQQLKGDERIATSIEELEEQLKKHKVLQEEIVSWSSNYNNLRQLADLLQQNYAQHDSTEFKTNATEIYDHWNQLETIANKRQVALQNALDHLLLFHKDMTAANTWLSDTESRVAGLDSHVEASHAEDAVDMQGIKHEMNELEMDISSHQPMFQRLNETSNAIMNALQQGEVRTALQSKLDDMNDRWNSLGLHMVDIRDRIDGSGEWRQLLSDMQDIKDWLERADKELKSQQPAGPFIESVQKQNEIYEAFKEKLSARKVVIEQSLEQGHKFLAKHQAQSEDAAYKQDDNLVARAAANLQVQLEHVESQWQELNDNSNKWEKTIQNIAEISNRLLEDIDYISVCLLDLERVRDSWQPVSEMENIHDQLEEVKNLNERATSLELQFDNMNGSAKELRHGHNVALSKRTEGIMDQLHERWKQLLTDCQERPQNLQNIMSDIDHQNITPLQGSVLEPWERGQSLNKVPYFINHDTKTTQWDHPKMTELYHTLSELNDVKFAAYRTSMKLRCIQKACCLDLVELHDIITDAFTQHGLQENNETLIDVGEMIAVLVTVFENVTKARKDAISEPQCVDMTLNWLLNVYDSGRIGKLRILSFKVGIVLMSRAKLEDKWRYLFEQIEDSEKNADSKKLGLLLHDCVQIPRQLGEIAAFGGSNIEPSVRSCFERVKEGETHITSADFISWTAVEPQSLVWMPVLHRLAAAETAKHEAKCNICKEYPIVGFRYRCLKCFNYDLCQNCFWSGRVSKSHRVTHPMHQYSLATTTGEDMSDFVKLMKNKFKSRRYRSRPPKKLGYLPVQTIMEGSNIETPSLPTTPTDMNFPYGMDGSASPGSGRFQMNDELNEEHRLIQQMCQSLNSDPSTLTVPKSPSQILKSLDRDQKQDIDELISGLEEEHQALLSEYNRLKGIQLNTTDETFYNNNTTSDAGRDAELIAEAKVLRQHKGRLESRMQTLEEHNRQLEAQLQRLRQLLEQPPTERERAAMSMHTPSSSSSRVTPALTPSSSYHGTPEPERRDPPIPNGYSNDNIADFHHVTSQIEHAFPVE